MSEISERFAVLVLSLFYVVAFFCFSSSEVTALPTQQKGPLGGTSNGTIKIANLHVTKNKHESPTYQTTKKPVINQDNARVSTTKKINTQKISENMGESTTKKIFTQKITGSRTTEKSTKQNSSSSNSSINRSNINNNSSINRSNISINSNKNININNSTSNCSTDKPAKISLPRDSKDLALPSDSNSTSEHVKRSSAIKVFTIESEDANKPIEIEVKTYTAAPNASAIIEVRPKASNDHELGSLNYPYEHSWPIYQTYPYPQEMNGPQDWYTQQYQQSLPSSLTYVPTEELLHGQSFSNTPSMSSQLLYQHPVEESIYNKPLFSPRSRTNHIQHVFSKLLNNKAKISNFDPKDDYTSLPNHAANPLAQFSPYQTNTPLYVQNSLPQNYFPPYLFPHSNKIQNSVYTQVDPNTNNNPGVTKYVTNSYVLKTHPNLEWVPL